MTEEQLFTDLSPLVNSLDVSRPEGNATPPLDRLLAHAESLKRLRHSILDNSNTEQAKDVFRHLQGFHKLLDNLKVLSDIFTTHTLSEDQRSECFALVDDIFSVLVESLRDHSGNKRYFATRVGGWEAVENALRPISEALKKDRSDLAHADEQRFFGCLFAAAVGEETLSDTFTGIAKTLGANRVGSSSPRSDEEMLDIIQSRLSTSFRRTDALEHPDIIPMVTKLWLGRSQGADAPVSMMTLAIPAALLQLAKSSQRNLVAIHTSGLLGLLLPLIFDSTLPKLESQLLQRLAGLLCSLGVHKLDDAFLLYRMAATSTDAAQFLLDSLVSSRSPANIQFDMSLHGYCSIELPTMGRSFPPTSSAGYTLAVWVNFDDFDPNEHTTIFGAFDASQSCFVLAYLEKDTRNFILQTSIHSDRPSVRFKSVKFQTGRWYHICIVHKRARTMSPARASLFVDGEFVEQLKLQYPSSPPAQTNASSSLPSSYSKGGRVQAFLGTPQDLVPNPSKGSKKSRWSLASATLVDEALGDDLISVYYHLGPRYYGNFQDCLGSFQTYQASAELNMRNELLHPGKEERSDIVTAIKSKASLILPESRIVLAVSPLAVLDNEDRNAVDESQLIKSLSKRAAKNLQQFTRSGSNAIAINGAVPAINDALTQAHGVALLTGDPIVSVPQSIDEAGWRIGGCAAVGLSLVAGADTSERLIIAVRILFESVKENWRNSEAMERDNGYSVLATILRDKVGSEKSLNIQGSKICPAISQEDDERTQLTLQLLGLVLDFLGYNVERPQESVLNNPLAYRVLLIDLDIWRCAARPIQEAYYRQFLTFGVESKNHAFNMKRLNRMSRSHKRNFNDDFTERSI